MSRRGWVLFTTLSVLWGIPYLLIKVAVTDLSPAVVVSARCLLAAIVLLPLAMRGDALRQLRTAWRWVLLFAAAEIAVPFGLLAYAERRLASSLTGLLVALVPLLTAGLARLAGAGDRLTAGRAVGLVVGLGGVACLVGLDLAGGELPHGDLVSILAVAGAAAGYALGPLLAATRLSSLPSPAVTSVALAVAGVGYLPAAIASRPRDLAAVPASAWLSVAALGLVCSALAFLAFFALVAEVGPARATVITYLNPVVAVGLGVWLLDEPVTRGLLVGAPLVLLGSWLATRGSNRIAVTE